MARHFCACAPIARARFAAGETVIMDNLPAHKVAGAREATETAGVDLLYLQPNFRGLNPIEMASSKRKSILRAAAPRSAQDHWQTSRRTAVFHR
jgi:transposase